MGSKELRKFDIMFVQLTNGEHSYDFEIDPAFFNLFEESIVDKGVGEAHITLKKTDRMLQLFFEIRVQVELICDLSLKKFQHTIESSRRLIVKFGEEDQELEDDIIIIKDDAISMNVAEYLYEFISLEIPMKRVHPSLNNEDRPDLAYSTPIDEDDPEGESIDPRWEALKKLKE
ncbi:MAG: hypothetical protein ACI92W_002444 [Paraglaciecola sp.]|jgi:uncharacterized protein